MRSCNVLLASTCALVYPAQLAFADEDDTAEYSLFDYLGTLVANDEGWVDPIDMENIDTQDPDNPVNQASSDAIHDWSTGEGPSIEVVDNEVKK